MIKKSLNFNELYFLYIAKDNLLLSIIDKTEFSPNLQKNLSLKEFNQTKESINDRSSPNSLSINVRRSLFVQFLKTTNRSFIYETNNDQA